MALTAAQLKRKYLAAKGQGAAERIALTQAEASALVRTMESFEQVPAGIQAQLIAQENRITANLETDLRQAADEVLALVRMMPNDSGPALSAVALIRKLRRLGEVRGIPGSRALQELEDRIGAITSQPQGQKRLCADSGAVGDETDILASSLPYRCKNALMGAGIRTLSDVLTRTKADLRTIPNLGANSIFHISTWVSANGHSLAEC